MLVALALAVTGCSASTNYVSRAPRLDPPDSALTQTCPAPQTLPGGPMTQRDIERYWSRDRISLVDCGKRHDALTDYYVERDAALRGSGQRGGK